MTSDVADNSRPEPFQLGPIQIQPDRNRLCCDGRSIRIEPKVMDVLCKLAQSDGKTLSREAIISDVWDVRYGGDESLTRAISILRKSFRKLGLLASPIETVSKRGYRMSLGPAQTSDMKVPTADLLDAIAEQEGVSKSQGDIVITISRGALAFTGVLLLIAVNISLRYGEPIMQGTQSILANFQDSEPPNTSLQLNQTFQSPLTAPVSRDSYMMLKTDDDVCDIEVM